MIQQQLEIERVVLLGCPDHGITDIGLISSRLRGIGLGHIRIGPIVQHRLQPGRVVGEDRPEQQWISILGEDRVRVHALHLHQPPHFLGIALLGRQRQRQGLGVGEVALGRIARLRRWRAAGDGQQHHAAEPDETMRWLHARLRCG